MIMQHDHKLIHHFWLSIKLYNLIPGHKTIEQKMDQSLVKTTSCKVTRNFYIFFPDDSLESWPFRVKAANCHVEYQMIQHEDQTEHCAALIELVNTNIIKMVFTRISFKCIGKGNH